MHMHRTTLASFALLAACAADPTVPGSYAGSTSLLLPMPLPTETLDVDAALTLSDDGTFALDMDLTVDALAIADSMDVRGTYVAAGGVLTLEPTGFDFARQMEPDDAFVREDGAQCVSLDGFAGTEVCLPTPQDRPYTLSGNALTLTLVTDLAGAPTDVTLPLTRTP